MINSTKVLLQEINRLKESLMQREDNESISYTLLAIIKNTRDYCSSLPEVETANPALNYKHNLDSLEITLKMIQENQWDINTSKFQASASVLQLMIAISGLDIDKLHDVIKVGE